MKTLARTLGASGIWAAVLTVAWADTAAPSTPASDWKVTTAPARFVLEPAPGSPPGVIGVVALNSPDARWESMPLLVYTDTGQAVGADVLWTAPNHPATLVFNTIASAKKYFVYAGSNYPAVHLADREAGTWLEAREGDGKTITKSTEMMDAWNGAANKVVGRLVTNGIYEGGNHFGPERHLLTHLQTWLELTAPTHFDFAMMSNDASFVSVDGKPLVEWPGLHDAGYGPAGPPQAGIDLAPGRHAFDYYNAYVHRSPDGGRAVLCTLAVKGGAYENWTQLSGDHPFFRNAQGFHVTSYELQSVAKAGAPALAPSVAFTYEQGPESIIIADLEIGLIAQHLACLTPVTGTLTWTFDDGSTAQGQSVDHLFPRGGMRTVRLSLQQDGKETPLLTQVIHVHPLWPAVPGNPPQLHPEHRADIMARNLALLPAGDLVSCIAILGLSPYQTDLNKLFPALVPKMADVADSDLPYLRDVIIPWSYNDEAHSAEVTQALRVMIDRAMHGTPSPEELVIADKCRLALVNQLLVSTENTDEAGKLLDAIKPASLSGDEQRVLTFRRGDLAVALGDLDAARKHYIDISGNIDGPDLRSSVRRTAKIGQARAFLEKKDFDGAKQALDEVAWRSPVDTLTPEWALTELRMKQDQGLTGPALLYARRLLPILQGNSRAELLYRLATLAFAQNDPGTAGKSVSELLKKYPYSPEAAQAKQKWPGSS